MCRSRRELSNEYLLAKIGVDTAENEPLEVWGEIIQYHSFVSLAVARLCFRFLFRRKCTAARSEAVEQTLPKTISAPVMRYTLHAGRRSLHLERNESSRAILKARFSPEKSFEIAWHATGAHEWQNVWEKRRKKLKLQKKRKSSAATASIYNSCGKSERCNFRCD